MGELFHLRRPPGDRAPGEDGPRPAAPSAHPDHLGAGAQAGLWPHGISGDIPIVLVRIDDVEDMKVVRQLLRAHEYWRMKQLPVDLVILNERTSSYVQDLQIAIETSVRSSQSRPRFGEEPARGTVFMLNTHGHRINNDTIERKGSGFVARHPPGL